MSKIDLEEEIAKSSKADWELYMSSKAIAEFFGDTSLTTILCRSLTFLEHEKWAENIWDCGHEVVFNDCTIDDQYNFFVNDNRRWEKDGYVLFAGWRQHDATEEMYLFKLENRREELSFDD